MRKALFLILSLCLLAALLLPVAAAEGTGSYAITVYDKADFFTEAEEAALRAVRNGDTYGVRFFLVTSQAQMSAGGVHSLCGIGGDPAVVLVIDGTLNKRYYEMFTFNEADELFSNSEVNGILDDDRVYDEIKYGSLLSGATVFFDLCQQEIEQENGFPWTALVVALIIGTVVGGITVLCVFISYRKKRHGVSYPLDRYATMNLTQCNDRFVGSYVTRVRVQSSSGGGRSGGGGGGFSGGSRGRR